MSIGRVEAGKRAGLPASVFCKGTQRLESRYLLGMNGGIEAEVTFCDVVRGGLAIEAPSLFARFDPLTFNSIIILEDLTARVEFGKHAMKMPLERAQSQMNKPLAALHSKYYESPELVSTLSRFNDWEDYFAVTVEEAGFGEACQRGFEEAEAVIPPALFRRAREDLGQLHLSR